MSRGRVSSWLVAAAAACGASCGPAPDSRGPSPAGETQYLVIESSGFA